MPQLIFDPPQPMIMRNKLGGSGKGHIVSIDLQKVVVDLASGRVELDLDDVTSIKTNGFLYNAKVDLEAAIREAASLDNTQLVMVPGDGKPAPANGGFGNNGGFGAKPADEPTMDSPSNGGFGTAKPANTQMSTNNGGFGQIHLKPGESFICGNCNKEVTATSQYGQKCPHCGIEWFLENEETKIGPAHMEHSVAVNDPDANAGFGQSNQGRLPPPSNGTPRPQGQPQELPPSIQAPVEEMNFANIPAWIKAVLFFGFIAGGYYMFFYRA